MRPNNLSRLDESLTQAWNALRSLPEGWRLGGGTAVSLYLGHRASTDLDWVAPSGAVEPGVVASLNSFGGFGRLENIQGGRGMMDCVLQPHRAGQRSIRMTFMEPHKGFLPDPALPPQLASNPARTPVLHLSDLAASKLLALRNRRALRDYEDLAALCIAAPEHVRAALRLLQEREDAPRHWMLESLADVPVEAAARVAQPLRDFALDSMNDTGVQPSD